MSHLGTYDGIRLSEPVLKNWRCHDLWKQNTWGLLNVCNDGADLAHRISEALTQGYIDWNARILGRPFIESIITALDASVLQTSDEGSREILSDIIGAYLAGGGDANVQVDGMPLLECLSAYSNHRETCEMLIEHPSFDPEKTFSNDFLAIQEFRREVPNNKAHYKKLCRALVRAGAEVPEDIRELFVPPANERWLSAETDESKFMGFKPQKDTWDDWLERIKKPTDLSINDLLAFRNIGKLTECLRDETRWAGYEDLRANLIMQLRPSFQKPFLDLGVHTAMKDEGVADKPFASWESRISNTPTPPHSRAA